MGSGKRLKYAVKKYGLENFHKEILFVCNSETQMNAIEKILVVPDCETNYNLAKGGIGGFFYVNKTRNHKEHNKKIAENRDYSKTDLSYIDDAYRKIKSDDTKRNWAEGKYSYIPNRVGMKHTDTTKQKMSSSHTGVNNSQFGTCWITDGKNNMKIKKNVLDYWVSKGYRRGRS